MNATLAPRSSRLAGRVRMGDTPSIEQVQDLQNAVGVGQFAEVMKGWSLEQIKWTYLGVQLIRSIRTKMKWIGKYASTIASDPGVLGQFVTTPAGGKFISAAHALSGIAAKMDLPNLSATLGNLIQAIEVNVLAQKNVGVRAIMPAIHPVTGAISYVLTNTVNSRSVETLDIGDFSKSSLEADLAALDAMKDKIDLKAQLGAAAVIVLGIPAAVLAKYIFILLMTTIITTGAVMVANKIFSSAREGFNDVMSDPNWQTFIVTLAKTNPEMAQKIMGMQSQGRDIMADVVDLVKWGVIGVGTITVGGIVWWIATR